MRTLSKLNTYYRLLILILSSSALFFLLYICLYFYTVRQEKNVYRTALREYNNEVSSIFTLNSRTNQSTIYYVTYWDELVNFTKSNDKQWYHEFIVTEFEAYESDYLGIYNIKGELLSKSSTKKINSVDFIPKEVFKKLYKDKLTKFYLKIPEGIVEVFGATTHPTDDPKRIKSRPSGYFFLARLIDKSFIKNLEIISSSTLTIGSSAPQNLSNSSSVIVSLPLKDWKNELVADLVFKRSHNLNFYTTKNILLIIILATVINLLVYLLFFRKWIFKPINLVTNILETNNETAIKSLKKLPGEFGYIGNLFEENTNQRKQLEIAKEKAEESDRLKSSFLANLSHEIRTPMNAIMGFSDLLNDPHLSLKERADYLKIIRNSGKNLTSIIEDLLEMSKIDSKQITPNYKAIDLDKCLSELQKAIKITIPEEKNIQFFIQENTEKLNRRILTDEVKLKQILTNLITNAIKFTVEGHVSVGYQLQENGEVLSLHVEDTGLGINAENIKIIFERFRRVEDEFSVKLNGLGLGLSITKAYVELLGGQINVSSTPGVGSTFSFTIPLKYVKELVEEQAEKDPVKTVNNGSETILVAEDDDINFMLMQRILQLKKYTVLRANNGKEAVDICRTNPDIDLILMDIKMPVMDGFQAFESIRTFNRQIPIIANTAYSSTEDKDKILGAGFTNYISKPLNKDEIFDLLGELFNIKE